ncbi:ATP-binding protein [Caulobacter sp. BE254]|uniref:sensor histidine kinase n=1 Tax=Caulobacter sp. BE254 TaxID=2817720 RepID=UPI00286444BE|nr:ATP-binding protein [Caulobacter sp. BE254]MDR7118286.1 signal transduction histidine kinase [Caulobacter sp. BE254]
MRKPADLGVAVQGARKPWLGYGDLRLEAAIFLLVAVSFAAVLGKSAITRQTLVLSSQSGRFATYSYSDAEHGGGSVVSPDPRKPLSWSCDIRQGASYPYCGYGLQLDVGGQTDGLDFSRFQTIVLRFSYQGPGDRLRLVLKTSPEPAVRAKLKGEPMPLAMDIPVVQGRNEVRLPLRQLAPEEWWVASHGLSAAEAAPNLEAVRSVAVTTSDAKAGHLAISVDDLTFEGSYLSTEQFYLVILGVWLVLSAGFLVWRFLHLRGDYEARRRRQAEEARQLADAHAAAQAASSAKSRFLGNMSHELRTPLNAIIGYAYWLERTALDAKQRAAVKTVQASGEHLLAVISDILDVAKIEAGKFELLAAPFDLHDCVAGVGEMFRLPAQDKGLAFAASLDPDVPPRVEADEKRVRQVLINLVGNAIKFTADGRVGLRVSLVDRVGETARLRFVVDDTGIGIPLDQVDSIFRPFEQAGDATGRNEGTGLGLSISQQIVALMQGEISVDSTPGQGSRFTVEIAVRVVEAEAAADAPRTPRLRRLAAS